MATEEQTQYDTALILQTTVSHRGGQRITISNRTVTKLGFWLRKYGNPPGSYYFSIRKVSDDSVIVSEAVGTADSLTTTITYTEHTFASPPYINEEVRILVEYTSGNATNLITTYRQNDDVKASEDATYYQSGAYTDRTAQSDHAYIYTYTASGGPSGSATVTTQECTNTIARSSIGHGLYSAVGSSAVSQYGHCWSTSPEPTTADSKTENGAAPNLGQFKSSITGLTPGTTYYVRAYATNTEGTNYGADVTITTGTTIGKRYIWIEGKELHYFDEYGAERKIEGVPDASGLPWWWYY